MLDTKRIEAVLTKYGVPTEYVKKVFEFAENGDDKLKELLNAWEKDKFSTTLKIINKLNELRSKSKE